MLISVPLKFQMADGPIGVPGLDVRHPVVGEDSIDIAPVPILHRPEAENVALGPGDRGDSVSVLAQNV